MLYGVLLVVVLMLNLILALFVLLKNVRNHINISFSLFVLSCVTWIVTNFVSNTVTGYDSAFIMNKLIFISSPFIAASLFYFSIVFPYSSTIINFKRLFSLFLPCFAILLLTHFNLVITGITFLPEGGTGVVFGTGIYFFVGVFLLYLLSAIYLLIRKYRKSKGYERLQLQYLIFGISFFLFFALLTNLIIPLVFNNFWISNLGPFFTLIMVGFTAYAIVRHKLLDIRFILARTVLYSLLLLTITITYSFGVIYASRWFLNEELTLFQTVIFVALTVFVSVTYQPLRNTLERITNKVFFKTSYDPRLTIRELTQTLSTSLGFEEVLENIYQILAENLHVGGLVFAVKLQGRKGLPDVLTKESEFAIYAYGRTTGNEIPSYLFQFLESTKVLLSVNDLQHRIDNQDDTESKVYDWMHSHSFALLLPLIIKSEVIGVVIVGDKKSGEAFSVEDLDVLKTFSLQAAIGIENILLFMHSRDFNERLKLEVEQATGELKQKNRNLEVLRKMDSIITNTLDLREMCQKIVDTISWELGYDGALISLVDHKNKQLVPTAVSQTPKIKKALALLPKPMSAFTTDMDDTNAIAIQAINSKRKVASTSLAEAFKHVLPRAISDAMQAVIGLKGIVIYPLITKDRPLGVMSLAMHIAPQDLPEDEQSLLDAFMDEAGIALENAYLYEEARNANAALKISNQKLIELDQMKDEFVSVASHELRTPMTAINGYVWMVLQGRGGDLTEKQKNYLNKVAQSTQRLINLVNDMLSVSRLEGGRIHIDMKKFDLVDLVKSVHEELQIKADERNLNLSVDSDDEKVEVYADSDKTHEVLINLIGNALKFTDKGSITTQIKEKAGMIVVNVIDTGKGIASEDMSKLFQKFGRLDNQYATVAETTGTGLGLYICKKYVELMGGSVKAVSEVNKGSTFTFTLKKG